jgi:hypothetical protein
MSLAATGSETSENNKSREGDKPSLFICDMILSKLWSIFRAKNNHFLYVGFEEYKRWSVLFRLAVWMNGDYTPCEIYRKKYKNLKNFVVIGLRWSGRTVKRRTVGYAKRGLSQRCNQTCIYCGNRMNPENATSDHIVPISKKGNNCQVNLVICCRKCNTDRGNLDFATYIRRRNPRFRRERYIFI